MSFNDNAKVVLSSETTIQHFAEIFVNGQSKGKRQINGTPSLREFSQGLAREFGIKAFTVSVDGTPVTKESQANEPVKAGASVSVATKESRGSDTPSEPAADLPEGAAMESAEPTEPVSEPATEEGDEHSTT